jgi:hypothetical protein
MASGGATFSAADVAAATAVAVNVNVTGPDPVRLRSTKVATPATAVTESDPERLALPLLTAAVTLVVDDVTRLPAWSLTSTTGCVVRAAFDTAPAGCVRIASCVAAPGVTVTVTEEEETLPADAAIPDVPVRAPVTLPDCSMIPTVGSDDIHVTVSPGIEFPSRLRTSAENDTELPEAMVCDVDGVMTTVAGVVSGAVP